MEPTASGTPGGVEKILVVDDEPALRDVAQRVLVAQGYRVTVAESGSRALEILRAREFAVDLLLTDIVMPGMDGRKLAVQASLIRPHLPVLYMSGYPRRAPGTVKLPDEHLNLLHKPFNSAMLLGRVRQTLDGRADETAAGRPQLVDPQSSVS